MAFLSVIIAAHNAEATLHATLSSLLAATDQDTEISSDHNAHRELS